MVVSEGAKVTGKQQSSQEEEDEGAEDEGLRALKCQTNGPCTNIQLGVCSRPPHHHPEVCLRPQRAFTSSVRVYTQAWLDFQRISIRKDTKIHIVSNCYDC